MYGLFFEFINFFEVKSIHKNLFKFHLRKLIQDKISFCEH